MSEWWIDYSEPGPQVTDPSVAINEYSIPNAGSMTVYSKEITYDEIRVFEDVFDTPEGRVANWAIGDRIYNAGVYVGKLTDITRHIEVPTSTTITSFSRPPKVVHDFDQSVVRYTIEVKMTREEMEEAWNQRLFLHQRYMSPAYVWPDTRPSTSIVAKVSGV